MSDDLKNIIEAVLLVSDSPVTVARIQSLFDRGAKPEAAQVNDAISALQQECSDRGIELQKIGSGYRYQSKEKYADYLRKLHATKPPRMSRALLETLAIIAYRQPVSRGDIEEVRGVAVSPEIMQRLIEREWVKQVGVRDVPGRPALFGTTPEFLSYFNLGSLTDLPELMEQREFGEIAGEMDIPLPPEVLAALESTGQEQQDDQKDDEEGVENNELDQLVGDESVGSDSDNAPSDGNASDQDTDTDTDTDNITSVDEGVEAGHDAEPVVETDTLNSLDDVVVDVRAEGISEP